MKKFLKIIIVLIIIFWIIINILSAFNLSFFGIRVFRVGSGSMEPYLKVNDLIIIKTQNNYEINDVITFEDNNNYITHRIIEKEGDLITTKGDSNNTNDPSISEEKIVGKMIYKFRILGFLSYLLLKPFSWALIFVFSALVIMIKPVEKAKGKHMLRR